MEGALITAAFDDLQCPDVSCDSWRIWDCHTYRNPFPHAVQSNVTKDCSTHEATERDTDRHRDYPGTLPETLSPPRTM